MFIIFIVPVSVSTSPNTAPDKTQDRISSLGHTKAKSEMYMSSRDWLKVSCIRFFFSKGMRGNSCKSYGGGHPRFCILIDFSLLFSQRHGLKSKKLLFYDLLQSLAFKHCDGVVDIQTAPVSLDSTDAVSKMHEM